MKIEFDEKTYEIKFKKGMELNDDDLIEAVKIKETMNSEGWEILSKHWEVAKEGILDRIKFRSTQTNSDERCGRLGAVLKGFDDFNSVPLMLIQRAEKFVKEQEEIEKENKNETEQY